MNRYVDPRCLRPTKSIAKSLLSLALAGPLLITPSSYAFVDYSSGGCGNYTTTYTSDGHTYKETSSDNGNCTVTRNSYTDGVLTFGPGIYPLCNCAGCGDCGNSILFEPGTNFGFVSMSTTLAVAQFAVFTTTNVDKFQVYNLQTGGLLATTLAQSNTVSYAYSNFTSGTSYAVVACNAHNLIQGAACFQAGVSSITPLFCIQTVQNDRPDLPGVSIVVLSGSSQGFALLQYSDGTVVSGTAAAVPALNIAKATGDQTALFWPASATNLVLQSTTNLVSPDWMNVTNGTPLTGVMLSNALPAAYYRLQPSP